MPKVKAPPHTYLSDTVTRSLANGLSRAEGHIGAVKRMIEERRCCDEILIQIAAVKAALNRVTPTTLRHFERSASQVPHARST